VRKAEECDTYENKRNAYSILVRKPDDDHVVDLGVIEENILKWILSKQEGRVWSGLIWLKTGVSGGLS